MYAPRLSCRSEFLQIRGLRYHLRHWGADDAPVMLALHGWMDVSASFQFVADHLAQGWHIVAPDWRGFGMTGASGDDCYEFTDYLGDLDAIVAHLQSPSVVLMGHSMGGNAAMLYAGVRPDRVRAVINLEGFGLPGVDANDVPKRLATWLDQIADPPRLRPYDSLDAVAARLRSSDARLSVDQSQFLAGHWARQEADRWVLRADPAHKILNRVAYRVDEVLACWRAITAPVLWVEAQDSDIRQKMNALPGYRERLTHIPLLREAIVHHAGHMLHHDQPEVVAQLVADFLAGLGR